MLKINKFERDIRNKLKQIKPEDKIYLKENYEYEIFTKHDIHDYEINYLFDMKRIINISENLAFPDERIDAIINAPKDRKIKIIFMFDPIYKRKKLKGKVGIITAFVI